MNPHVDAVPLAHAGRTATVRFTWRALKVLQRDWGKDWQPRFVEALTTENVEDLEELVALTTGMTAAEVEEWGPPINATVKALWDGFAILKTGQAEQPQGAANGDQNPPKARSMLSTASAVLHAVRAWAGPSSGTARPTPPAS